MQDAIAWRWSEDPEQKRWMDWKTDWTHHDEAKARGFPVEYAVALSALNESGKVYFAMLRGEIPKLTWRQMVHLSGPVPNTADEALAEITRLRGEVKSGEADIDRYVRINAELATELEKSLRVLEEARRVSRELHGADRCTKCGYLFLESEHIGCIRRLKALGQAFAALDEGPTPAVAMPPADAAFASYCDNRAVLNGAPGELKREDDSAVRLAGPPFFEVKLSDDLEKDFSKWAGVENMSPWKRSVARLALLLNSTNRGLIDYEAAQHFAKELMERAQRAVMPVPNDVPEGDNFNGTTPHMIQCIESLVAMNDRGILVPHGLCGHSRTLLLASANRLRQQAAPAEWREVMTELADDLAIEIDQSYPPERRAYPSEQRRYEREMEIVNRARALLQSSDVKEFLTTQPDCRTCANRGQVNGLSQESYCESCVYQGRGWRQNHFVDASKMVDAVKRRCEACVILPCSCK